MFRFAEFCTIWRRQAWSDGTATGRSSARLERLLWEQEVAGSNPVAPTNAYNPSRNRMDPILPLSAKRTALFLAVVSFGIVLTGWIIQYLAYVASPVDFRPYEAQGLARLFNLGGTANIPTWYKAVLLMFASVALFFVFLLSRRQRDPFSRYWRDLGVIFFALSIDEVAVIHRGIGRAITTMLETRGVLFFGWVILATVFVVLLVVVYARFLRSLPVMPRWLFIGSGSVYVLGALIMKYVEGWYVTSIGRLDVLYITLTAGRQLFQMIGVVVFLYALLSYLRHNTDADLIRIYH